MKSFQLKKTILTNSQTDGFELNYRREFLQLVEVIPEGITISQMGTAIKVAEKLRHASDEGKVFLEDAEHEYLLNRLKNNKWKLVGPEIVEMVKVVEDATTEEAPHLAEKAGA